MPLYGPTVLTAPDATKGRDSTAPLVVDPGTPQLQLRMSDGANTTDLVIRGSTTNNVPATNIINSVHLAFPFVGATYKKDFRTLRVTARFSTVRNSGEVYDIEYTRNNGGLWVTLAAAQVNTGFIAFTALVAPPDDLSDLQVRAWSTNGATIGGAADFSLGDCSFDLDIDPDVYVILN